MTIHLGNDSAVRRQSWADRARDADGDVAATAEHADAHTGIAAASPGALSRLLAPSPRDPNAQRARSGPDADGAVRDQPPRLVKPSPPKLPREPMWHAHGPRGVAAEPVATRSPSPSPAAPPQRETIVRAAVIAPRGQPIFGDGGAIVGAAGSAAAAAIATQPALQPASSSRLVRIAQSLQAQTERAHHQAELRHAALTPTLQGGSGWLHHLGQFSSRLHALIARLQTPVPALQAAARDAAALNGVTSAVHQRFAAQAGDKGAFTALLRQAFGDKFDAGKAETIRQQALAGDFSWAPKVQVVSSQALADLSGTQGPGSAQGAYVQSSDTIYISRELLHGDPAQAQRLLMEEMGHGIDARINTSDALGDEGEIFGKLMHGDAISAPEMAALRADNDHGVVNINGQAVTVEYGFFSKAFKAITGGIKKVAGAVTRGVVNLAKSAVTVATGLVTMDFDKVKDGLKDGVNAVKTSVKAVHQAVKDTAKELHRITKQAFQKLMQSKLFAAVLMICRFIPIPIVALVVHVIDLARAAYMVYQGIKHKSLGAVLGGVASLVGGAGNVAGAFGASAATVNTISNVATAASRLSMAYNVVANKDIGSALGLLGGAVGGPGASTQMNTLASATGYAQQALNIREAVRSRDALAALGGTLGLGAQVSGNGSAMGQNLSQAQEVVTGLRAVREIGRGNLDAAQSLASGMGSAQAVARDFNAGVEQRQRDAEAANNRTLLNAADAQLRAGPAEQDGGVVPATRVAFDDDGNLMPGVTHEAAPWSDQLQQLRGQLLAQGMDPATAAEVVDGYSQRTLNDAVARFLVAEPDPVLVAGVGWTPDVRSAREVIDSVESRIADGSLKGPEIGRAIDETYQGFLRLSATTVQGAAPITHDQELAATRLLTLIGDLGQIAKDEGQVLTPEQQALVRQSRAFEAQRAMPEIMGAIGAGGILAARRTAGATRPTGVQGGRPIGEAETIPPSADSRFKRGIRLQNEAADTLAAAGYRVEYNPQSKAPGADNHDVFVEGRRFDVYSPAATTSADNIVSRIGNKLAQADRVVLNLAENPVSRHELRAAFAAGNTGIKEVIVIGPDKVIYRLP